MRTAEKLRALMEALGPEAVLEMTDIPLPQIVAVVEAAEEYYWLPEVAAALAALDVVLT